MFDLVNLPEEEEFIRNALIGNVLVLSMVRIIFVKGDRLCRMHRGRM